MPDDTTAYLGDGVYARWDGLNVWVWTSNGVDKSQEVALERDTFISLQQFARQAWGKGV